MHFPTSYNRKGLGGWVVTKLKTKMQYIKKVYIHKFSRNPLPLILLTAVVLFSCLFLLEGLTKSEISHCLKTSTIKSICK